MRRLARRDFLRMACAAGLGWLAAACSAPQEAPLTPAARPTPSGTPGTPTAPATPAPAATAERRLVANANVPGMYVRYFKPFYPPTRDEWRLEVRGLVENPRTFRFAEIRSEMPKVTREARLKCVECWSARRTWSGFTYAAVAQRVRPLPEARYVEFRCADTYWEVLSTEELAREGVVFAYELDGALLPDEYGAPLRLLVPWKYGYKMPKAIVSLEFRAEGGKGYWPTVGPYTPEGDIQPGVDYPLDLGKERHTIPGGEITAY